MYMQLVKMTLGLIFFVCDSLICTQNNKEYNSGTQNCLVETRQNIILQGSLNLMKKNGLFYFTCNSIPTM